jgi:phosphotransferase system IIA component
MQSTQGTEILIHIGIDTVKLEGKHFTTKVKEGDVVGNGDLLIQADLNGVQAEGYDITTVVLVTNSTDYSEVIPVDKKEIQSGDTVISCISK